MAEIRQIETNHSKKREMDLIHEHNKMMKILAT